MKKNQILKRLKSKYIELTKIHSDAKISELNIDEISELDDTDTYYDNDNDNDHDHDHDHDNDNDDDAQDNYHDNDNNDNISKLDNNNLKFNNTFSKNIRCFPEFRKNLIESLTEAKQYLSSNFKTPTFIQIQSQVDLMLEMMPSWTGFLADNPAYGHYNFINRHSTDLIVFLTIDRPKPNPRKLKIPGPDPLEPLLDSIKNVFQPFGCRVSNCYINYLDDTSRSESYHQNYLRRPINNQRYQLLLLALESRNNWAQYISSVEVWEIKQLIRRYFRTNLTMVLDNISFSVSKDVSDAKLVPWTYIFDPFYRLGHPLAEVRELAYESLEGCPLRANQYPIIKQLVNLAYRVNTRPPDPPAQGIWKKVFKMTY